MNEPIDLQTILDEPSDQTITSLTSQVDTSLSKETKNPSRKILIIAAAILVPCLLIFSALLVFAEIRYNRASALSKEGEYLKAIAILENLGNYRNSERLLSDIRFVVTGSKALCFTGSYAVGLKNDGTLIHNMRKDPEEILGWESIAAIDEGLNHYVGLRYDGTVIAAGSNSYNQCNVFLWTDIIAVSAGDNHTIGLKSDGTLVATGDNKKGQCEISDWTDIVAISAGKDYTIGLKSDGTAVATEYDGNSDFGKCYVSNWKNVVAISAGETHTACVRADGTVAVSGRNNFFKCEVEDWTDIIAVCVGENHTVGLKSDGTVVAVGDNARGQCNVSEWTDVVAIYASDDQTYGIQSDGTILTAPDDVYVDFDPEAGWNDIRAPQIG